MVTPQLYDQGEESWKLKIHCGAGNCYLENYWNIDLAGLLAKDYPAETLLNVTDVRDYYARLNATFPELPQRRACYVDEFMDMRELQYPRNSISKILAIQCFEHLSPVSALSTLINWWSVLTPGGVLVISVPDMRETLKLLEGTHAEQSFAIRHLRGSARDEFNYHQAWYTPESFTELLQSVGFTVEILYNFHLYPAIVRRARKG